MSKKLDQKKGDHSNFAEQPRCSILVAESLERFPFSPTDTFRKRDLLAAKNIDSKYTVLNFVQNVIIIKINI